MKRVNDCSVSGGEPRTAIPAIGNSLIYWTLPWFFLTCLLAAAPSESDDVATSSELLQTSGRCDDPTFDPCTCVGCDGSMGASGCTSANGGCCYYYSTGWLNKKDGESKNQQWTCSAFHPHSRGIVVNAGGKKQKDEKGLYYYNPLRICFTGNGENGDKVVHLPFVCEEGAHTPCEQCALDSLERISKPKEAYVGWDANNQKSKEIQLPGECKTCGEGYKLHPLTRGCCPDDGTWEQGEHDVTCSALRRNRGFGMPADGGYCECRGCGAPPTGLGKKGCGSKDGGCCWFSVDKGGTCTDTKLPGMTDPTRVCNILNGDKENPKPSSQWQCTAGVNEPCLECGGYGWNVSLVPVRVCTKCNVGYELIDELGSCCKSDSYDFLHVLLFLVVFVCVGGAGYVAMQKFNSKGSGSGSGSGYTERGMAGRAGDYGL